jgi:PPM family protein phosphatase
MLRVAEYFHGTDLGRQRTGNEDSHHARPPLFVVADGMGGAQAGEVASQEAVSDFQRGLPDGDPVAVLERLIHAANRRIHTMSQEDSTRAGMGTTLTAAYLAEDDRVVVAHVGDSRCYLFRNGELTRLTRDHTLVDELVRRGKLTEEQAESHPQRSVITRALGPYEEIEVDVEGFDAKAGDIFLLCSDGLTSMVPETRVGATLEIDASLEQLGRGLIEAANTAGGRDNITVILFRLEDTDEGGAGATAVEEDTRAGDSALRTEEVAAAVAQAEREEPPKRTAPLPASASEPLTTAHAPVRKRRRVRIPAWAIVSVLLIAVLVAAGWMASRAVYFLGTDPADDRTIVLFRGLPYELPGGVELYEEIAPSGLTIDAVPESRRKQFTDHKLRSRDDAEELLVEAEKGRLVE